LITLKISVFNVLDLKSAHAIQDFV